MIKDIKNIVKELAGDGAIYLDDPIVVKTSPHTHPLNIWAVVVNKWDDLLLMDDGENWHKLEETDRNYEVVAATVGQRVRYLLSQHKKTA